MRDPTIVKFGYYILTTYVPELDGGSEELYAHWLEQIDVAEGVGFDALWVTEHHFRYLPWIATNEAQRNRMETYFEALRASGHAVASKEIFGMYPAYIGDSDEQARSDVMEHWHRWRHFALQALGLDERKGEPYRKVFAHLEFAAMVRDARALFGGPETCVSILRRIMEAVAPTQIGLVFHFGGSARPKSSGP